MPWSFVLGLLCVHPLLCKSVGVCSCMSVFLSVVSLVCRSGVVCSVCVPVCPSSFAYVCQVSCASAGFCVPVRSRVCPSTSVVLLASVSSLVCLSSVPCASPLSLVPVRFHESFSDSFWFIRSRVCLSTSVCMYLGLFVSFSFRVRLSGFVFVRLASSVSAWFDFRVHLFTLVCVHVVCVRSVSCVYVHGFVCVCPTLYASVWS